MAAKLHQQVDDARRLANESVAMVQAQATGGLQAVDDLESKFVSSSASCEQRIVHAEEELREMRDAAERSTSDAIGGVSASLTKLVNERHSEGAQRLQALAKALDAQSGKTDIASSRIERELLELRSMSQDSGERLKAEMATMRRFVIDQTKTYLAASAGTSADKQALEERLHIAHEENYVLSERLHALEQGLRSAAPASHVAALAAQLQHLQAGKASKDEVQMLIDEVQRPAVAISRADGSSSVVNQGDRGRHGTHADGPADYTASGITAISAAGGGARSRPRSACAAARIVPGNDFGVMGKDGALYRGQEPPALVAASFPEAVGGENDGAGVAAHIAMPAPPMIPPRQGAAPAGSATTCEAYSEAQAGVGGSGMRVGAPPGTRGFMPKPPGAKLQNRPARAYESLLSVAGNPIRSPRSAATSSAALAKQRPRSATTERSGARSIASLGEGYAACRQALVSLEEELQETRSEIEFVFDPKGRAGGSGEQRVMWLQWIATAGGGWAFYEPNISLAPSDVSARTAIATQRASLADFLSQVETRYVGFADLTRVVHSNTTLWVRGPALVSNAAGQQQQQQPTRGLVRPSSARASGPADPRRTAADLLGVSPWGGIETPAYNAPPSL